jgi:hypothetical protein
MNVFDRHRGIPRQAKSIWRDKGIREPLSAPRYGPRIALGSVRTIACRFVLANSTGFLSRLSKTE